MYRVCLKKGSGKLIEMQSGVAPLGTLTQNAVNAGYNPATIEEKLVTPAEWADIERVQITEPAKAKALQKKQEREAKVAKAKIKLGLNDNEWEELQEGLKA